jgi:hypothetical protein
MTSPPSPPNRRRRRIVVTIAVLMFGLGWWFWPRADARFLGNWDIKYKDQPGSWSVFMFSASGRGTWKHPDGSSASFFWRIEGDRLIMGIPRESFLSKIFRSLQIVIWRLTGFDVPRIEETFDIVHVNEDAIQLEAHIPDGSKARMILTRLPE